MVYLTTTDEKQTEQVIDAIRLDHGVCGGSRRAIPAANRLVGVETWFDDPEAYWAGIDAAVRAARLPAPVLAVDAIALEHNIADLRRRAGGAHPRGEQVPARVRSVISDILRRDGFAGVLAYTVDERHAGSPPPQRSPTSCSAIRRCRRTAIGRLLADETAAQRVALFVDSPRHLDVIDATVAPSGRRPVRVAIDLDASLRYARRDGPPRRASIPIHSVADAARLAATITRRPGFTLVRSCPTRRRSPGSPTTRRARCATRRSG